MGGGLPARARAVDSAERGRPSKLRQFWTATTQRLAPCPALHAECAAGRGEGATATAAAMLPEPVVHAAAAHLDRFTHMVSRPCSLTVTMTGAVCCRWICGRTPLAGWCTGTPKVASCPPLLSAGGVALGVAACACGWTPLGVRALFGSGGVLRGATRPAAPAMRVFPVGRRVHRAPAGPSHGPA